MLTDTLPHGRVVAACVLVTACSMCWLWPVAWQAAIAAACAIFGTAWMVQWGDGQQGSRVQQPMSILAHPVPAATGGRTPEQAGPHETLSPTLCPDTLLSTQHAGAASVPSGWLRGQPAASTPACVHPAPPRVQALPLPPPTSAPSHMLERPDPSAWQTGMVPFGSSSAPAHSFNTLSNLDDGWQDVAVNMRTWFMLSSEDQPATRAPGAALTVTPESSKSSVLQARSGTLPQPTAPAAVLVRAQQELELSSHSSATTQPTTSLWQRDGGWQAQPPAAPGSTDHSSTSQAEFGERELSSLSKQDVPPLMTPNDPTPTSQPPPALHSPDASSLPAQLHPLIRALPTPHHSLQQGQHAAAALHALVPSTARVHGTAPAATSVHTIQGQLCSCGSSLVDEVGTAMVGWDVTADAGLLGFGWLPLSSTGPQDGDAAAVQAAAGSTAQRDSLQTPAAGGHIACVPYLELEPDMLGTGGFGSVYRVAPSAVSRALLGGALLAVKLLPHAWAPAVMARVRAEAEAGLQLRHTNIITHLGYITAPIGHNALPHVLGQSESAQHRSNPPAAQLQVHVTQGAGGFLSGYATALPSSMQAALAQVGSALLTSMLTPSSPRPGAATHDELSIRGRPAALSPSHGQHVPAPALRGQGEAHGADAQPAASRPGPRLADGEDVVVDAAQYPQLVRRGNDLGGPPSMSIGPQAGRFEGSSFGWSLNAPAMVEGWGPGQAPLYSRPQELDAPAPLLITAIYMECATHGTLTEHLAAVLLQSEAQPLSPAAHSLTLLVHALPLLRDAAVALEFLAHQHLVHGDIKASNCLVTDAVPQAGVDGGNGSSGSVDGSLRRGVMAKLCDLGLMVRLEPGCSRMQTERAIGTPTHMAPEMAVANMASCAIDIYSFGVMMWEALELGSAPYGLCDAQVLHILNAASGARPLWRSVTAALNELDARRVHDVSQGSASSGVCSSVAGGADTTGGGDGRQPTGGDTLPTHPLASGLAASGLGGEGAGVAQRTGREAAQEAHGGREQDAAAMAQHGQQVAHTASLSAVPAKQHQGPADLLRSYVRLAESCWAHDPLARPTAAQLTAALSGHITESRAMETAWQLRAQECKYVQS